MASTLKLKKTLLNNAKARFWKLVSRALHPNHLFEFWVSGAEYIWVFKNQNNKSK